MLFKKGDYVMAGNTVEAIDTTVQKTHIWLKELTEQGHFVDQQQAYSALRAVLHALRDRMTADEAVHLGSELPMLIRGLYFEGWKPSSVPNKERGRQAFFDSISNALRTNAQIAPEHATRAVFELLDHKISGGEIKDVKQMIGPELRELWPVHK
jgi:uncharacterized protein (DUF2267 family)